MAQLQRSRAFYERQFDGEEYALPVPDQAVRAGLVEFIRRFGLVPARVLDLGCGRGAYADLVERWIGADIAHAAGRRIGKPFLVAYAEDLPVASGSLDALWTVSALEHVQEPERALEEIARVLRPGGVAWIAPAWHCRPWAGEAWFHEPWERLGFRERLLRLVLPLRESRLFRGIPLLFTRLAGEWTYRRSNRAPLGFRHRRLRPNYESFLVSDSDAVSSMDPHEMILWFLSRGWDVPSHPGAWRRLSARHGAVVVRKPAAEG